MSKLVSIVNKDKVFLYVFNINHKYNSSVERHMLADSKVRGSILHQCLVFVVLYEFTQVFRQKLQGKTRVQNTRGARERELTESRV